MTNAPFRGSDRVTADDLDRMEYARNAEIAAERDRYADALRRIRDHGPDENPDPDCDARCVKGFMDLARAALEGKGQ